MHHDKVALSNAAGGRNLLDHDKRADCHIDRLRSNAKIDPELWWLNRDLSATKMTPGEAWDFACRVAQEHSPRKLRANSIVMAEEVVHLPRNWDEVTGGADSMDFFEKVALPFLRERYGVRDEHGNLINEISAVVHRDEKLCHKPGERPGVDHLHYKSVPLREDGRLSHKDVHNRADLRTLHKDLAEYAERAGYHGLELYEEREDKGKREALEMPEYKAAQQAVQAEKERLEETRRANEELTPKVERIRSEVAGLEEKRDRAEKQMLIACEKCAAMDAEMQKANERLESVQRQIRSAESQARELERECSELESEAADAKAGGELGEFDSIDGTALEVSGRARALDKECQAAVAESFKGAIVPDSSISRDRAVKARAAIESLRDALAPLRERLGHWREVFEGFASKIASFGIFSRVNQEEARSVAPEWNIESIDVTLERSQRDADALNRVNERMRTREPRSGQSWNR